MAKKENDFFIDLRGCRKRLWQKNTDWKRIRLPGKIIGIHAGNGTDRLRYTGQGNGADEQLRLFTVYGEGCPGSACPMRIVP